MVAKGAKSVPESLPTELKHPYYPWDLKLPHYVPNELETTTILAVLGGCSALVVLFAWVVSGNRKEPFCFLRRLTLCWFLLCAFIHTVLEGYFAVYHATLAGHKTVLGETWKEYSMSDSRYLSSDTFTVCMESITAVIDGPLAFVTFWAFMSGSNYRYALQMILSLCQLYGDVLYFLTEIKEGFVHGPFGHPLYFCFYFVFLNSLWIVIPSCLIVDSARHIASCQTVSDFYIDEYNKKQGITNNHSKKNK
ncbi:3-beta-hydroxysteroid-Delta(8),Delta(7)-isomerase [Aplysia californica]|uniref:3-beta-hydroxysteroid-Delta(8), Delta(7)-isomerase n=1 Tax=Aplysia californica TaxID=6500 RepID=A0ABM0K703_APLCA|nr:3-beta-hydroxysteroid-Delta(8),Delta(7)-isomerase [Aplysia californica]